MRKHIKTGDKVKVIAGNDKGQVGEVLAIKKDRILIKGVNVRKKHMKQRSEEQKSQIVEIERPIHISNVAMCNDNGDKLKLFVSMKEDGSKDLCYQEGSKEVTLRTLRKKK
ncbi:MAG: hypothetical protein SP1CHLAM54_16710 [Chlamydiia bacterium]|nr:hypothetical protein [Chlamydiia bacterium]MCH9616560.1 hypothetical protein [Chlamydiia bacterium]MCH9629290.1 hypothetical protein [Chlamydiia bacterium]